MEITFVPLVEDGPVLGTEVVARAHPSEKFEPATITFRCGPSEVVVADFAPFLHRLNDELKPCFDAIVTKERLVVLGLSSLLVFDLASTTVQSLTPLYRPLEMDCGWLSSRALEGPDGSTLIVYESGVVALDDQHRIRWHRAKAWDDCFVELSGTNLSFLNDEASFMLRIEDGSLW